MERRISLEVINRIRVKPLIAKDTQEIREFLAPRNSTLKNKKLCRGQGCTGEGYEDILLSRKKITGKA